MDRTWTTEQLREEFEVIGFMMGLVVVRRRADGVLGAMEFTHAPREYYGWQEYAA